jgi:hypothetical protein
MTKNKKQKTNNIQFPRTKFQNNPNAPEEQNVCRKKPKDNIPNSSGGCRIEIFVLG